MTNEIATIESDTSLVTHQASVMFDIAKFEQAQRVAKMLATSNLVPDAYRNNIGNCVIAFDLAARLNVHPLMLMQNTYVVSGRPGFEGKFVISLLNASGFLKKRLRWEHEENKNGETEACTCIAELKDGDIIKERLTWNDVVSFGWHSKQGSPWLKMRRKMFEYRTASFLVRTTFPELLMGMQTVEEVEEIAFEENQKRNKLPTPHFQAMQIPIEDAVPNEDQETTSPVPTEDSNNFFTIIGDPVTGSIAFSDTGESYILSDYNNDELEKLGKQAQQEKNDVLYKMIADELAARLNTSTAVLKENKKQKAA